MRLTLACVVAATFAFGTPGTSHAEAETRLSLDEARQQARDALIAGQAEKARLLASGLLLANPEDVPALLLQSRAERDLGNYDAARQSAQRAWDLGDGQDRYFAALAMAQALSSDGKRGRAQIWLRRAAQIAPSDALEAKAARDFAYVKSRNPWEIRYGFDFEHSSNINGAPKTNTFTYGGLEFVNPNAVPLDGYRYGVEIDVQRKVPLSPTTRLRFGASGEVSRVELSEEARDKVSNAENADYAYDALTLRTGLDLASPRGRHLSRIDLTFGRDWRAEEIYSDHQRLTLSHMRKIAGGLSGGLSLSGETEQRHGMGHRDTLSLSADGFLAYALPHGQVRLGVGVLDTASESAAMAKRTHSASLSYAFAKPVFGTLPSISLIRQETEYNDPVYGPEPRADSATKLSVNLVLPELDFYGFAPVVGLSHSDTRSNYELFETDSTNFKLGLRSLF